MQYTLSGGQDTDEDARSSEYDLKNGIFCCIIMRNNNAHTIICGAEVALCSVDVFLAGRALRGVISG